MAIYQIAEGIDITATYGEVKNSLDERWFTGFDDKIDVPARRALVFVVTLDLDEVCLAEAACRKIRAFSTPQWKLHDDGPRRPSDEFFLFVREI